MSLQVQTA